MRRRVGRRLPADRAAAPLWPCRRLSGILRAIARTRSFAVQIRAITAYRLDLPFRDGPYICSGGRSALGFISLIVRVGSNDGLAGWGEMAPLGGFYDPAFPGGARAAFGELAAVLIGQDPRQLVCAGRRLAPHLHGPP